MQTMRRGGPPFAIRDRRDRRGCAPAVDRRRIGRNPGAIRVRPEEGTARNFPPEPSSPRWKMGAK